MATTRVHSSSGKPLKLRNYEGVAAVLIGEVKKAANGVVTFAQARTNVANALTTIVTGGASAPAQWASFTDSVSKIIDGLEQASAATSARHPQNKPQRLLLLDDALGYLNFLVEVIAAEEDKRQRDRGHFILVAEALNPETLRAFLTEAGVARAVLTFEAS